MYVWLTRQEFGRQKVVSAAQGEHWTLWRRDALFRDTKRHSRGKDNTYRFTIIQGHVRTFKDMYSTLQRYIRYFTKTRTTHFKDLHNYWRRSTIISRSRTNTNPGHLQHFQRHVELSEEKQIRLFNDTHFFPCWLNLWKYKTFNHETMDKNDKIND